MKALKIPPTDDSPEINFDPKNERFTLSGKSTMINAEEFYQPVFKWIDENLAKLDQPIEVVVKLEYLNTSSSKVILDLLTIIENKEHCKVILETPRDE